MVSAAAERDKTGDKANKGDGRRKVVLPVVCAIVLAALSALAVGYLQSDTVTSPLSIVFVIRFVVFTLLLTALFMAITFVGPRLDFQKCKCSVPLFSYLYDNRPGYSVKKVLLPAAIMLACWLPYFIALFPGDMSNDTTGQLAMFFSSFTNSPIQWTDHHPIFDTVVFGSISYVGYLVTGNLHIALAICILVQMIVTALAFALALAFANEEWQCDPFLCGLGLAFFAVFPVFPLVVTSLSKDTFFSWVYVLFFVLVLDFAKKGMQPAKSFKRILLLSIACVLLALTKKLGIWIMLGTILLLVILMPNKGKVMPRLLIPVLTTMAVMWVVLPISFRFCNVQSGGTQEMLAIPLQQSALTYLRHGDEMDKSETEVIGSVIDFKDLGDRYDPLSADPVKGYDQGGRSFGPYLGVWAKQGLKYPDSYFDAWASLESPLLSTAIIRPVFNNSQHTWDPGFFPDSFYEKPSINEEASRNLEGLYVWLAGIPVINVLFMPSFYIVFLPVAALLFIVARPDFKRRHLIALVPGLMCFAGLLVSPTVKESTEMMRYVLPFLYSAPLLLLFLFPLNSHCDLPHTRESRKCA